MIESTIPAQKTCSEFCPAQASMRPGAAEWGVDPSLGELRVAAINDWMQDSRVTNRVGNYAGYYAAVRDAVLGTGANPVPPEQAVALMELLDLGVRSAREGRALAA